MVKLQPRSSDNVPGVQKTKLKKAQTNNNPAEVKLSEKTSQKT